MTWTMDNHWRGLPAIAGAQMLAALIVAVPALVSLPDRADAQATAAQQNAVRHYCRADFAAKCPGVSTGEAIICLEANLDGLSRNCKKAVLTAMGADSEAEPVADAAPAPAPRATSRPAPIVSTKPPGLNPDARHLKRRNAPATATSRAPQEAPPPDYARPRKGEVPDEAAAPADAPPRDAHNRRAAPPEHTANLPPEEEVAPRPATPARRARSAPPRATSPLVRACWNELVHNCRGMRPGGGRELACLSRHSRSLSPRCWDAYRTAMSRRR